MKSPRHQWTPEQRQALRERYPHERTADIAHDLGISVHKCYAMASQLGLKKTAEFFTLPASERTTGRQGIGTRFEKGLTPWNKGTHFTAGGRSAETRFKKGEMRGAAQHNYVPIDSLRVTKDGYLERKMSDDPSIYPARRWTPVHRLVWEAAHGPVPKGCIVRFKKGMKTAELAEVTLDRLEMLSKADNMRRNSHHTNYPKEVCQLIQLRGAVKRKINRLERANGTKE